MRQGVGGLNGEGNAGNGIGICAGQYGPHGSPDKGIQGPAVARGVGGTDHAGLIAALGHIVSLCQALGCERGGGHGRRIEHGPLGPRVAEIIHGPVFDFPGDRVVFEVALIIVMAQARLQDKIKQQLVGFCARRICRVRPDDPVVFRIVGRKQLLAVHFVRGDHVVRKNGHGLARLHKLDILDLVGGTFHQLAVTPENAFPELQAFRLVAAASDAVNKIADLVIAHILRPGVGHKVGHDLHAAETFGLRLIQARLIARGVDGIGGWRRPRHWR